MSVGRKPKTPKLPFEEKASLRKGQKAVFQVLNRKFSKAHGRFISGKTQNVPSSDRIMDESGDDVLDLSYILRESPTPDGGTKKVLGSILFEANKGGQITLYGDKPQDRRLCRYLRLCNYNQDNKGEEFHIQPKNYIFKEVRVAEDAKQKLERKGLVRKTENTIDDMSKAKLQAACRLMALNPNRTVEEMKVDLMNKAARDPRTFLDRINSSEIKYYSQIRMGLDMKLITIKSGACSWIDGGIFHNIPKGVKDVDSLYEFFSSQRGGEAFKRLELLIEVNKIDEKSGEETPDFDIDSADGDGE